MLTYLKGSHKRSMHFENESILQNFLQQFEECQELISDMQNQIKNSSKEDKPVLKEYLEFYLEEKSSLEECMEYLFTIFFCFCFF